jgi:citrate lyase subunit beta/citryl-CoA lyase
MDPGSLRLCRSLLYVPASNPRALANARDLNADMILLDCEDSVRDGDKTIARAGALAAAQMGFGGRPVAIRINAVGTVWHDDDLAAVAESRANFVVLPKVESASVAESTALATGRPVLAMIETPLGVLSASAIAPATAGLIAGTNDLAAALGIPASAGRAGLGQALQAIVLAARAAGVAVFDGVCNRIDDDEELACQCHEGRSFGFDGKTLIHPRQIEIANRLFGPSDEEVETAQRLIAAATGGAERFEGRMIEAMHVAEARAVLAKARC